MTDHEREAEKRARELLVTYLSPQQRLTLSRYGYFYVRSQRGSVFALDGSGKSAYSVGPRGSPMDRRMFWPRDLYVRSDRLLAQMLLIETDYRRFDRIACTVPARLTSVGPELAVGVGLVAFCREQKIKRLRFPLIRVPPARWPQADGLFTGHDDEEDAPTTTPQQKRR